MADIFDFASSAGANNTSGALFEEGLAAALVSDKLRELQAAQRRAYNDAEWIVFGSGSGTPVFTFISATQFRVTGDVRTQYHVGRAARGRGATTGTIYGNISASTFAGATTTVTVDWKNSGQLKSDADLQIALGILSADPSSLPIAPSSSSGSSGSTGGQTITGDLTVNGSALVRDFVKLTSGREISRVLQMRSYTFAGGSTSSGSYQILAGDAAFTPLRAGSRILVEFSGRAQVLENSASIVAGDLAIANASNVILSAEPRFQLTVAGATNANWLGTFSLRVVVVPGSTAALAFRLLGKVFAGDSIAATDLVVTITEFLDS